MLPALMCRKGAEGTMYGRHTCNLKESGTSRTQLHVVEAAETEEIGEEPVTVLDGAPRRDILPAIYH